MAFRLKLKKREMKGTLRNYQFDPVLGFWGIPNIELKMRNPYRPDVEIKVTNNDDGIRDIPFQSSHPQGAILCIGGSHSWGGGVAQEERYSDLLAHRIGRQVINLGQCSLGIDQAALVVLNRTEKYNPKIIVIEQYPWAVVRILNNYVNNAGVKPGFFLDAHGELKLRKIPWLARFPLVRRLVGSFYSYKKELQEFQGGIDLKAGYDPLADPIFLHWKIAHYEYLYQLLEKIILVIRDYCRQRNIKLIFCLGAILQQFIGKSKSGLVDYDLPRKRLINILNKFGIDYIDMTDAMLKEHSENEPVIFCDGHINGKGHDVFATALEEGLKSRGWI